MTIPDSEHDLAGLAVALIGSTTRLTKVEQKLVSKASTPPATSVANVRKAIKKGEDPLGTAFCRLRNPIQRREQGATFTPLPIIDAMIDWAINQGTPERIVDPGAGSGRFLLAAGKNFPKAELIAIEIDPLSALLLRANATVLNMARRLVLHITDYRSINIPKVDGPTLFIGNPPYVRHHNIPGHWKEWLHKTAASYGFKASKLAGLHVHFFLKTRQLSQPGDYGIFITSAEWLDVNYGALLRKLLTNGLGGTSLYVLSPTTKPFADATTTGAITCFHVGHRKKGIQFSSIKTLSKLGKLNGGRTISWARLEKTNRWSPLLRSNIKIEQNYIELGDLCRVHRGQVTGCNAAWIAGAYPGALPNSVLFPTITRARELFNSVPKLTSNMNLRHVIDLPIDLDVLDGLERQQVMLFLEWAKSINADKSYIAKHRRAWWSVGLREPAPILCTYMARQPPAFVRNLCEARHLNIAHGIYPKNPLPNSVLDSLAKWLHEKVHISAGRTYAGGLTKFEPKEIERIRIPPLEKLYERAQELDFERANGRFQDSQRGFSETTAR